MNNNVIRALQRKLYQFGFCTMRFNMRGVGNSTGRTSWTGSSEITDLQSTVEHLKAKLGVKKILLVGNSYGSVISVASAYHLDNIIGTISISYPSGGFIYTNSSFMGNYLRESISL